MTLLTKTTFTQWSHQQRSAQTAIAMSVETTRFAYKTNAIAFSDIHIRQQMVIVPFSNVPSMNSAGEATMYWAAVPK